MDRSQSYEIIRDTFQNAFDKERFVYFIKNLLNNIEESPFIYRGNYIPDAYENYINTLERIGKYSDGQNKLDILIVNLKKETSIERARTMQRNFIAWYLNGSRGNEFKDAALVAFVSPNKEDWRFSLVKMEYKFEKTDKKMKVKEEFTPARRWSFLVGQNENSHTAQSRLAPILEDDKTNPTLQQLEEAFNIEKVTKEFFEKYRELFLWTKDTLEKVIDKDRVIKENFQRNNVDTNDFAKKLLGQIVFLYFLQKKGWFGVNRDDNWGTGPKNFLRQLFDEKHGNYKNFFNDILEPLFYEALALEREDDFYSKFNCKIPFLNGGLFDPINNYDWIHTDIVLPNELFSNQIKDSKTKDIGTGILDIFDRYNFTVKEDEPLEKEVAVDPEMLGKVFENLLHVKDRKSKGTYYTPREIVHYMCEQSLINYLVTELKNIKVFKEDIQKLIQHGESVAENEARVNIKGKESKDYSFKLPASIRNNAKRIDEKLADIKVCDPAIGSGAFPVGMMNEIVKARLTLNAYLCDKGKLTCQNRTTYDFKFECIQNSLYGVDIDPSAVEIAKLRLWLSLVVDEDDIKRIKPLPNLDYKIMQGNSLLEEYEGIKLFDEKLLGEKIDQSEEQLKELLIKQNNLSTKYIQLHQSNRLDSIQKNQLDKELKQLKKQIVYLNSTKNSTPSAGTIFDSVNQAHLKSERLKQLHKEFFQSADKKKKKEIKKQIGKLEWELIEVTLREQNKESAIKKLEEYKLSNIKPFFLWKLNFAEVFQEQKGFDVVIANPPYVEHKKLSAISESLQKFDVYSGRSDLYVYFYELALNILNTKGTLCFISSNKFVKTSYGEKLREYLNEYNILNIIDFSNIHIFEALVSTIVIILQKYKSNIPTIYLDTTDEMKLYPSLSNYIDDRGIKLSSNAFNCNLWIFVSPEKLKIKEKIEGESIKIADSQGIAISRGITTGLNEAFLIDSEMKEKLIEQDTKSKGLIKPILQGRNIRKWVYKPTKQWIIIVKHKFNTELLKYKAILNHLQRYEAALKNRGQCKIQQHHWLELDNNPGNNYLSKFEKEKIIWGLTANKWAFSYDNQKYYLPSNGYILTSEGNLDIKYILALLNSNLLKFYFEFIGIMTAGGAYTLKHETISSLPINEISRTEQQTFIEIVDKILTITNSSDYSENHDKQIQVKEYEKHIDQMVYKLYDLSKEEQKIIEQSK